MRDGSSVWLQGAIHSIQEAGQRTAAELTLARLSPSHDAAWRALEAATARLNQVEDEIRRTLNFIDSLRPTRYEPPKFVLCHTKSLPFLILRGLAVAASAVALLVLLHVGNTAPAIWLALVVVVSLPVLFSDVVRAIRDYRRDLAAFPVKQAQQAAHDAANLAGARQLLDKKKDESLRLQVEVDKKSAEYLRIDAEYKQCRNIVGH